MAISREELLRLARGGAAARVQELLKELESIYKTFPDLRNAKAGKTAGRAAAAQARRREPGQRNWTAADRKAVSDRMRKYWAARRGTAGKSAKSGK